MTIFVQLHNFMPELVCLRVKSSWWPRRHSHWSFFAL